MSGPASDLPRITVVTPNLNGGDTLRETIESVLQQDYPNLEYILVDGGSTDASHAIIDEYRERFAQVLIGKDRNLYDGIAKGFDAATGDVLAWLNSDDSYEPGILKRVGGLFGRHPDWSVIYFDGTVQKQGWRLPNRKQKFVQFPEIYRGHILYQDSVFFRRDAYEAVGGLERESLKLAGDYQLWLRLAAKYQLHYVPGHASCFRIRPDQLSGDWGAYLREMQEIRAGASQYLPPGFRWRSAPGVAVRRVLSKAHELQRSFLYELDQENLDWAAVEETRDFPVGACRCPVCDQPPNRLLFSTPDTRYGDRTVRSLYLCETCEVAFLFPRPTDDELDQLHGRYHATEHPTASEAPPNKHSLFQRSPRLRGSRALRALGLATRVAQAVGRTVGHELDVPSDIVDVDLRKDALLIEVGCGNGRTLDALRERGFSNLLGIDLDADAIAAARARGHEVRHGDALQVEWPRRAVDGIVLNQLLEHLADPVDFLRRLGERLGAGGRIYVSTPNLDSAWLALYGPTWAHWHVPYHQFITGRRGLERIASSAGLRVRWVRSSTPPGWLYLSDRLTETGLGGSVSHQATDWEPATRNAAEGATTVSRASLDPLGRGDCLHACLVRD